MKTILVLGAGRSSSSLIRYLFSNAESHDWRITVGDISEEAAKRRIESVRGNAVNFDIRDASTSQKQIGQSDVVISLLPANLHPLVAALCVQSNKHFLSASYVSDEMNSLHQEASRKDLLLLNECGLDPGIDHMSAMWVIDNIQAMGGTLTSFESYTGGLITPDTDPGNPWRYKFTWNPRNVVMAGQGTAKFLMDGQYKYIPYHQLFKRVTPVTVLGTLYEGYPNRDSLKYLSTYGLQGIRTMIRGTLRNAGFCSAWDVLVQLGCCDDTYSLEGLAGMSHGDFINSFLDGSGRSLEAKLSSTLGIKSDGEDMRRLRWSGLFSPEKIGLTKGTPARVLEHILNKKWKLVQGDKDFIVMWHRFGYELNGSVKSITAHLTVAGENELQTAMAKTVGLPLGIAAKLLLEGRIKERGVVIPVKKEIYGPVLDELKVMGISVVES
jgi:saccharopine dehydrogenase-like NADP-dependent oxidoreductase